MEWQPIETAPWNEADDVLLAVNGHVLMGAFFKRWEYDRYATKRSNVWVIGGGRVVEPTHWMPVPKAPTGD